MIVKKQTELTSIYELTLKAPFTFIDCISQLLEGAIKAGVNLTFVLIGKQFDIEKGVIREGIGVILARFVTKTF